MGCTSGKQKRTDSIDDIPKEAQTKGKKGKFSPQKNKNTDKNGEVPTPSSAKDKKNKTDDVEVLAPKQPANTKTTPAVPIPGTGQADITRQKENANPEKVLLIPGAHNSFLAPDDIPFIDDEVPSDIDDEDENDENTGLNRNLTWRTSERQSSSTSPTSKNQDGGAAQKPVDNSNPDEYVVSSAVDFRSAPDSRVVQQILKEEVRVTSSQTRRADGTDGSQVTETHYQVVTDQRLSGDANDEKLDKSNVLVNGAYNGDHAYNDDDAKQLNDAAIKIQSRYKGYKARTQVKSIKKQQIVDDIPEPNISLTTEQDNSNIKLGSTLNGEHSAEPTVDEERAAIRIQSHYKGYKTRRSLKNN